MLQVNQYHAVLPLEAQQILIRASMTPITPTDPLARVKAIEKATQRVKDLYPQYFRKELNREN